MNSLNCYLFKDMFNLPGFLKEFSAFKIPVRSFIDYFKDKTNYAFSLNIFWQGTHDSQVDIFRLLFLGLPAWREDTAKIR